MHVASYSHFKRNSYCLPDLLHSKYPGPTTLTPCSRPPAFEAGPTFARAVRRLLWCGPSPPTIVACSIARCNLVASMRYLHRRSSWAPSSNNNKARTERSLLDVSAACAPSGHWDLKVKLCGLGNREQNMNRTKEVGLLTHHLQLKRYFLHWKIIVYC